MGRICMAKQNLISTNEFAKIMGVGIRAVQKAINDKRINAKRNGKNWCINAEKAKAQWLQNTSLIESKKSNKNIFDLAEKESLKNETEKKSDLPDLNEPEEIKTLAEAERREKIAKAKLAEMKADEQAGTLVNAEQVERDSFEIGRKVRDGILAVPIRIAHELAAEHDPHKVEVLLQRELTQALEELTKRKVKEDGKT